MQVFHPTTLTEVADLVRAGRPLEIVGRGSKRGLGHEVQADTQLHLSRLDTLRFYEPDEMVISVNAGMSLIKLSQMLFDHRQRLAFMPPDFSGIYGLDGAEQSIGGIVASNLSGSSRVSAGAARDHLIGFTAVNGRGEIFKSGGRVVKNVTGYDLCKLMSGSFGTLAVLTEITLRVLPLPEHEATLLLQDISAAECAQYFAKALGGPFEVTSAAWLPASLAPHVGLQGDIGLIRMEGLLDSVRERCTRLAKLLKIPISSIDGDSSSGLWRLLGNGLHVGFDPEKAVWRVSVPPSNGATLLAAFPEAGGWLDWAGGLVWLAVPDVDDACAQALRTQVRLCGGHAILVRAKAATRCRVPVFHPLSSPLASLNARVKAAFDPLNILNPGRMDG